MQIYRLGDKTGNTFFVYRRLFLFLLSTALSNFRKNPRFACNRLQPHTAQDSGFESLRAHLSPCIAIAYKDFFVFKVTTVSQKL